MKETQTNHLNTHEDASQGEETSKVDVVGSPSQETSSHDLSFTRLVYAKAPAMQEEPEPAPPEEVENEIEVEQPVEHDLSFTRLVYAKASVVVPATESYEEEHMEEDLPVDSEPVAEDLENSAEFSFSKLVYEKAPPLPSTEEQKEPLSITTIAPVQTPDVSMEAASAPVTQSDMAESGMALSEVPSGESVAKSPTSTASQDDLLRQQILALMPGAETIAVSGKTMRQKLFGGGKLGKLKGESPAAVAGDTQYKKIISTQPLLQVEPPKSTVDKKEANWETSGYSTEGWVLRSGLYALIGLLVVIGGYLLIPKLMPGRFGVTGKPNTEVKRLVKKAESDTFTKEWRAGGGAVMREKAMEKLRGFLAAETNAQKARFLREPGVFLNFSQGWDVLENLRLDQENERIWSVVEDGDVTFLLLRAKTSDFLPFHVIFVRSGDDLLIDWDASVGWSSIKLEEMANLGAFDSVMVRCVIEKGQLYTEQFPETEYSCYMLAPRETTGDDLFWAYTPLDSDLDHQLRALMNHGMFNVELREKVLVTLNVSKDPQRCSRKQLILDDIVHEGWVAPTIDLN